ncbi:MAG TPA: triacylglycerol lipase [Polyangiaceae bacterium]|nr:triacylglycerol lipase [Polyangiaceae bacterium]
MRVLLLLALVSGCGGAVEGTTDAGSEAGLALLGDDGGAPSLDLADPAGPPYPIVLVHGMAGFRNIGSLEYFYGVPEALRKDGHDVWVSVADPINDSEVRGAQVATYVQTVLAMTGKRKVNLIGHSQGGFDVRYVASTMGEHVAAVVTIAAPMAGDPLADIVVEKLQSFQPALDALLNVYGAVAGYDSNAQACIDNLSTMGATLFFERHPDDRRVSYYSIAGRSEGSRGDPDCDSSRVPPFIQKWNDAVDTLNPIFGASAAILDGLTPKPIHDGLVPVLTARHGTFLGCIPADHMSEVNQLAGSTPTKDNPFDAVRFYRDLADWLVEQGF